MSMLLTLYLLERKRLLRKLRWNGMLQTCMRQPRIAMHWTSAPSQAYLATQGSTSSTCSQGNIFNSEQSDKVSKLNFLGTGAFFPHLTLRLFIHSHESRELSLVVKYKYKFPQIVVNPGRLGCLQGPWQSAVRKGGVCQTNTQIQIQKYRKGGVCQTNTQIQIQKCSKVDPKMR